MSYKAILVDVFNMAYRQYQKTATYLNVTKKCIDIMDNEIIPRLESDGVLYLLFDPLPKSDLGESKIFKYQTTRQQICRSYKSNRVYNSTVLESIRLLKKYYTYKGEKIKIVISKELEADDFVEKIIEKESKGKILLITNDSDWSRYIDERVTMINKGFDKPYTQEEYIKENGIKPTIGVITLKKAIYGDRADNIHGIVFTKRANYCTDIDVTVKMCLLQISKENLTLNEIENSLNKMNFMDIMKKEKKTGLEELAYVIMAADSNATVSVKTHHLPSCWQSLLDNIRVIKSRCDDINKYIYWKPENEKYNKLMDITVGKTINKSKFTFGAKKTK